VGSLFEDKIEGLKTKNVIYFFWWRIYKSFPSKRVFKMFYVSKFSSSQLKAVHVVLFRD